MGFDPVFCFIVKFRRRAGSPDPAEPRFRCRLCVRWFPAAGYIAAPEGRWLALFGQSGVGKTHLCTAAFCALVRSMGAQGEYLRWVTDGRAIKAGALEPGSALFDRYRDAPVLYIDDLFKKRADAQVSDADLRLCFELLDARYNGRLPTILSCELTFEELAALDEAIAGRIREMCGPFLVSVDRDLRKNYRLRAT